jgi:hypothetical protein
MRRSDPQSNRYINRYINRYSRISMALNQLAVVCNGCIDVTVVCVAQIVGAILGK